MVVSGGGVERDLVSEGFELPDEVALALLAVVAGVEVVRAELDVVDVVVQDVPS